MKFKKLPLTLVAVAGIYGAAVVGCSSTKTADKQAELGGSQTVRDSTEVSYEESVAKKASIPTVKDVQIKGDINRMNKENFQALGIPAPIAESILAKRDSLGGKFSSVDDLRNVPGMNEEMFYELQDKLSV